MANKNARVIIPTAIVVWLLGIVVFRLGTPPLLEAAFVVAFVIAIPWIVFYLIADAGWSTLAKRYRAADRFEGGWTLLATGHMSGVPVDDPEYRRQQVRFVGTLRLGLTDEALYLSTLFSRIPLLRIFFPIVRIPWTAVSKARTYEAPGWVTPGREPGVLVQATYDPNYTGTFVELEIGEPPVFVQLPLAILADHRSRLPLTPQG